MSTIEHFRNYGSKTGSLIEMPSVKTKSTVTRPKTTARPKTTKTTATTTIKSKPRPNQKTVLSSRKTENKKGKSSISKKHWVKLLNDPSSKNLLKKVWDSKNPQQEYRDTIKKIASKAK